LSFSLQHHSIEMPNFGRTPEALLGRNDSKNPATTCRGITSSGRACRRALASPKSSPLSKLQPGVRGVVALVQANGEVQEADFYCWQHKDQAELRVAEETKKRAKIGGVQGRSTEPFPLRERSSIDTLVQRLRIDTIPKSDGGKVKTRTAVTKPPRRTETRDFASGQRVDVAPYGEKYGLVPAASQRRKEKRPGFWASLCCMTGGDDDYVEVVRHRKRSEQTRPPELNIVRPPAPRIIPNMTVAAATTSGPPSASVPARKPLDSLPTGLSTSARRDSSRSQTGQLLSLIPPHLSPQTTSVLLAELCKPISQHDEEGYIYIFWLTPQARQVPAEETARLLLAPPSRQHTSRRISDVVSEYSFDGSETGSRSKKTIMLKIGRANNVTRRMVEWQRQCGYALNLVRWYPYVPSSASPSPCTSPARQQASFYPDLSRPPTTPRRESGGVRKVPCVKRVERLIHLELAEKQVKKQCGVCGKEHREWFEVEASQAGVKEVDECVRRWVGWTEGQRVAL